MGASTRGYGRTCHLTQLGHATGEGPLCVIWQGRESLPRLPRAQQAWLCDSSYTDTSSGPLWVQSALPPPHMKVGARPASVALSHCMQREVWGPQEPARPLALLIFLFCEPQGWWESGAGERVTEVSPCLGKGGWEAHPDLRVPGSRLPPTAQGLTCCGQLSKSWLVRVEQGLPSPPSGFAESSPGHGYYPSGAGNQCLGRWRPAGARSKQQTSLEAPMAFIQPCPQAQADLWPPVTSLSLGEG